MCFLLLRVVKKGRQKDMAEEQGKPTVKANLSAQEAAEFIETGKTPDGIQRNVGGFVPQDQLDQFVEWVKTWRRDHGLRV
jgi:hypothetical protein